jgi:hypothetical protein
MRPAASHSKARAFEPFRSCLVRTYPYRHWHANGVGCPPATLVAFCSSSILDGSSDGNNDPWTAQVVRYLQARTRLDQKNAWSRSSPQGAASSRHESPFRTKFCLMAWWESCKGRKDGWTVWALFFSWAHPHKRRSFQLAIEHRNECWFAGFDEEQSWK